MATDPAAAAAVTGCPIPPKKIACGFYTSAAITNCNDGKIDTRTKVACWGRNHYNLQGHGKVSDDGGGNNKGLAFRDEGAPKIVRGGKDVLKSDIYEVSMGTNHTMFLRKRKDDVGGVLYGAGLGARYRLGVSKQVYQGEAGLGAEEFDESWWPEGPIRVVFNGSPNTRVLRVCCGADHTLCYTTDGYVYAWGANRDGQCGVGTSADVREPTRILTLPKEKGAYAYVISCCCSTMKKRGALSPPETPWGQNDTYPNDTPGEFS